LNMAREQRNNTARLQSQVRADRNAGVHRLAWASTQEEASR
jgi:hypothetical protein